MLVVRIRRHRWGFVNYESRRRYTQRWNVKRSLIHTNRVEKTAMFNMNNLLNGKDSRWLQLEVCREFQRNKCTRPDTECKFAHPPANVEVQNGRVTACYDSIKVKNHQQFVAIENKQKKKDFFNFYNFFRIFEKRLRRFRN